MIAIDPSRQHEALLAQLKTDDQLKDLPDVLQEALAAISQILKPKVSSLDQGIQEAFWRILVRFGVNLDLFFKISTPEDPQDAAQRDKIMEILKGLTLFRDATDYDLVCLSRHMQEYEIAAETDLMVEAEPVENVFILVKGVVDILVDDELVGERRAGEAVGELSCLRNELAASATVRTRTGCTVLRISRTNFMDVIALLPKVWKSLFDNMRVRVVDLNFRYSELLSSSCQGVVKLDIQGRVTREASQRGMQLLGIERGDGQPIASLLFADNPRAMKEWDDHYALLVKQPPAQFQKAAERLPKTVWCALPQRGERYYFLYYFPSYDIDDQLVSVSVCIDDRTEMIQAAEELEKEKAKAETANQAKSSFIAKMSHEMRTPLNGVIGFAELMQRNCGGPGSPVEHYTNLIISESRILLDMINSLLDMSKIAAGKLELDRHQFSLMQILEEVHSVIGMRAREKGLEYTCTVDPEVTDSFFGDSVRLRQVLLNLAGNAVKFTEHGSLAIAVSAVSESVKEALLRFEVQDTGIGIAEEAQACIFESFSQADSTITRKYGGTGLGTAISRELVGLMGGGIGVQSTVGKGSTFWFTACFAKVPDSLVIKTATEQKEEDSALAAVGMRWSGRVLLVEDYKTNQLVFTEQLASTGCEAVIAENGQVALDLFCQESFDLILMDVHMPVMDGLTATQRIRKHEEAQGAERTPIIALTAAVYTSDRQACQDAGMDDFLEKPLRQTQLISKLFKWLGPGQPVAVTPGQPEEAAGLTLPEALPGLEIRKAMDTMACSPASYLKVAASYYRENKDIICSLRAALAGKEWPTLEKLAHSLKGTSATIGAEILRDHALILEKRSRDAAIEPPVPELIDQVEIAYQQVMTLLGSLLPAKAPAQIPAAIEHLAPEALAEILQQFSEALLTADKGSISARLTTLKRYCNDAAIHRLAEELDNYDYEEALVTLQEIAGRLAQTR